MSVSNISLCVHLVWSTRDRLPLIDNKLRALIYSTILHEAKKLRCDVLAIGGVADHVHVLVRMPATVAVAGLVKRAKACSSLACGEWFRWQETYYAYSVGHREVPAVVAYIENQEVHHRATKRKEAFHQPGPYEPAKK